MNQAVVNPGNFGNLNLSKRIVVNGKDENKNGSSSQNFGIKTAVDPLRFKYTANPKSNDVHIPGFKAIVEKN